MRRRLLFALVAFVPLALGGVAAADRDEHRGRGREHEEHEEHEHRRFLPFFGAPFVRRYAAPPVYIAPYPGQRYDYYGYPPPPSYYDGYGPYGYGPYGAPPPPPPPGWGY